MKKVRAYCIGFFIVLATQSLVFPGLVAQGLPVEFLAVVLPERHETIHVGDETIVVMALEQVNHFMDNDEL